MRKIALILFLAITAHCLSQEQTLTFTSTSDAKFFVYLNGRLQNQKSSGMVTLYGLEEKEYHVRIVVDDPFEIATTQSIKPDKKHNEYTVQFNAVRERVYLKPAKTSRGEVEWQRLEEADTTQTFSSSDDKPVRQRVSIRPKSSSDTTTQRIINHVRKQIDVDD